MSRVLRSTSKRMAASAASKGREKKSPDASKQLGSKAPKIKKLSKPKGRPRKILSVTKHVARKRQTQAEDNATNSPLLRLPPELRTRIWRKALCGNLVHVSHSWPGHVSYRVCDVACTDHEYVATIESADRNNRVASYGAFHHFCLVRHLDSSTDLTKSLGLLQACRQIHQAALLPFSGNSFSFRSLQALLIFLKALVGSQAEALRTISMSAAYVDRETMPYGLKALVATRLRKVETLFFFSELDHRIDVLDFMNEEENLRKFLSNRILEFQRLPLASAYVYINATNIAPPLVLPKSIAVEWEETVRGQLRRPWEEVKAQSEDNRRRLEQNKTDQEVARQAARQ